MIANVSVDTNVDSVRVNDQSKVVKVETLLKFDLCAFELVNVVMSV